MSEETDHSHLVSNQLKINLNLDEAEVISQNQTFVHPDAPKHRLSDMMLSLGGENEEQTEISSINVESNPDEVNQPQIEVHQDAPKTALSNKMVELFPELYNTEENESISS